MANDTTVLQLLGRLARAPVRNGGILDIPFHEYAADLGSSSVVDLLGAYARQHRKPTLRAVLEDERFRRWVEVSKRSPLHAQLEEELSFVHDIVEEEYILDDDEEPQPIERLRDWAEQAGVAQRLEDPAVALSSLTTNGNAAYVLRHSRETVEDVIEGRLENLRSLTPSLRKDVVALAEQYVRDAGERAIAARREDARIAALAYTPDGEGARAFLVALDTALGKTKNLSEAHVTRVALESQPTRIVVAADVAVAGAAWRKRAGTAALVLDDWRSAPLLTKVSGEKKLAHVTLGAARRVLTDPRHPIHARLVAYLDESPWERVLSQMEALDDRKLLHPGLDARIEWHATHDRGIRLAPFLREGQRTGAVAVETLVRTYAQMLSPRDEAIARTLCPSATHYYSRPLDESRERTFRALGLLVGHDGVRDRNGVMLQVREGALGVGLEREIGGFRFVFDIAGDRLGARALRAALDAQGYAIHIDSAKGHVLLAHVGTKRAAVFAALAAEDAVFPDKARPALVAQLMAMRNILPLRLPTELAGEEVQADARPYVRLVRSGAASLALSWLVRPIASGPTFPPGEGPEQVLFHVDGKAVFATRSRDMERQRLDGLRTRMPPAIATGPLELARCEGVEIMLAVIEILREAVASGDAVVEWPKSLPRVVGTASFSKLRLEVSAERDWFGVGGAASVDGAEITLADLLAARRARERFVAIGPDKLVAIGDDLRARLDALEAIALPSRTAGALELARVAVPAFVELLDSRDQIDAAPAFWSLLTRIDEARASEPRMPRGFGKVLRPYQVDGFRWMSRLGAWGAGACLADEMGLGKTVQTLALLVSRRDRGPALVVAPTSVGPNWIREAERFAPSLRAILHRGADRAAALGELRPGDLLVTSYDIVVRDRAALSKLTFGTLVADEAQAIKNGATARAQALRSLEAELRIALTGTPIENRLGELYSLMEFLNPGFFGTEESFRARYIVPIERDKDRVQSETLARLVRPFLLRRKKADVLTELPPRTEIARTVERSPAERRLYEAARRTALEALASGDERARFQVLAEIMRLRRLACHPKLYDEGSIVPSSKLEAFLELVSELREGGHRALVFSQFTGHLALVEEALRARDIAYLYLDGKTPLAERTKRVDAFQAGVGDVFLISLKAGGTGLNLTGADTVIHLDPWWNPAVEEQATDRAHRIGQARPVTVVRLIAQGTIEEAVLALHADKRELAEAILEGAGASGKLSIVELGALIGEGIAAADRA